MYIKRLYLENLRCFEKLEIEFDQPGSSLLILGDNNEGKSTVLKSIAMGLCDESSAAALFRELPGEFVRRKKDKKSAKVGDAARIIIDLIDVKRVIYRIKTIIRSRETFERVSQVHGLYRIKNGKEELLTEDSFPWDRIFVSGYGAGQRTKGTADFQDYLAVDAVYPIFKYDMPLQNPELVIRRLVEAARRWRKDPNVKIQRAKEMLDSVKQLLAELLDLEDKDKIHLTATGIEIRGPWGRAELGEMGDGYRAIITWVLDLLAWWFLRAAKRRGWQIKNIRGIVLIDELEQHLHPRWQRYLLGKLKRAFPKVQFIATTHSPLCAASTADLGENECQLLRLNQIDGKVEGNLQPLPWGIRADQILTSPLFGLLETRNPEIGDKISRYYQLLLKHKLDKEQESELAQLRQDIEKVPEAGQFEEERKLRGELRELINELEQFIGTERMGDD